MRYGERKVRRAAIKKISKRSLSVDEKIRFMMDLEEKWGGGEYAKIAEDIKALACVQSEEEVQAFLTELYRRT